jgi:hypothetical protein
LPLSTRRVREICTELGTAARVPDCYPHKFRHTAASEFLAERPGAEIQLRSRLGQVSGSVLADYVSISDPTAASAAATASLSTKWGLGSHANGARPAIAKQHQAASIPSRRSSAPQPQAITSDMDMLANLAAMLEANPSMRSLLRTLLGGQS